MFQAVLSGGKVVGAMSSWARQFAGTTLTPVAAEMEKLIASMATEEAARKLSSYLNVWRGLVDAAAQ